MLLGQRGSLKQQRPGKLVVAPSTSLLKRPRPETAERPLVKKKQKLQTTTALADEHKEQEDNSNATAAEDEQKQPPLQSSTASTPTSSSRSWDTLRPSLHPLLLSYLASRNFHQMTPVQAATIPLFSSYKDVCVQAVTGSGKTLAFLLPILQRLLAMSAATPLDTRKVYALIITPTRELALQIHDELQRILQHIATQHTDAPSTHQPHITASAIIGGHSNTSAQHHHQQHNTTTHILTATPGRLEHLLATSQLNVSALEVLVLDEADRLLELGFEGSVDNIMRRLPKQRRTGLFSATQTTAVKQLSRAGLRNPVIVDVSVAYKANRGTAGKGKGGGGGGAQEDESEERKDSVMSGGLLPVQATPQSLRNYYHVLSPSLKLTFLIDFLLAHRSDKVIVFFLTCACVDYFHLLLTQLPLSHPLHYLALHGHKTQKQRKTALTAFKRPNTPQVLLSTDVAARGVDIEDVRWIVQFDAPLDAAVFVHRIGRTARMGREGESLLLLAHNEDAYIPYLHRMHVPITPYACQPMLPVSDSVSSAVKQLALSDRTIFESAQSAIVSYIRAYKEHQLSLLFRVNEMKWEEVGEGYGLLMWPVLPDLKWLKVAYDSGLGQRVRGRDIKYKDVKREKERVARMEVEGEKRRAEKQQREEEERERRKKREERQTSRAIKEKRKERTTNGQITKEWNELQYEANLLKKLKAKKISKAEFEKLMEQAEGEDEMDDEDVDGADDSEGDEDVEVDESAIEA